MLVESSIAGFQFRIWHNASGVQWVELPSILEAIRPSIVFQWFTATTVFGYRRVRGFHSSIPDFTPSTSRLCVP